MKGTILDLSCFHVVVAFVRSCEGNFRTQLDGDLHVDLPELAEEKEYNKSTRIRRRKRMSLKIISQRFDCFTVVELTK
jgi:hypothetical protein